MTQLVQDVNLEFRRLLEARPDPSDALAFLNQHMAERGCTFAKGPMPVYVKPYFIDLKFVPWIRKTTEVLVRALNKVTDLYFTNPESRPLFELKEEEILVSEYDPGYPGTVQITRNDAFMTDDSLWYVEFNADSPGGPMYSDTQADIIEELPFWNRLTQRFEIGRDLIMPQVLKTMIDAHAARHGSHSKPVIAVSGGRDSGTLPEFKAIVEWLKQRGYGSTYCDPRDWSWDGTDLSAPDGTKPDVIYRRGWLPDWTEHLDEVKPVMQALQAGRVVVVNPFRSILAANKSLLHVIQRPDIQKIFDAEEKDVILRTVPWTRVMVEGSSEYRGRKIDLYSFVRANREKLILKPIDMYGGKDVAIGPDLSDSEWQQWIERTLSHKFIAQEFIPIPVEDFPVMVPELEWQPKKINVNFYAYGGVYTGGVVRTSDSSVINVSKGGGMTPIMYVGKKL